MLPHSNVLPVYLFRFIYLLLFACIIIPIKILVFVGIKNNDKNYMFTFHEMDIHFEKKTIKLIM